MTHAGAILLIVLSYIVLGSFIGGLLWSDYGKPWLVAVGIGVLWPVFLVILIIKAVAAALADQLRWR